MRALFANDSPSSATSSDSESDDALEKKSQRVTKSISFRCAPQEMVGTKNAGSLFVIDTSPKSFDKQEAVPLTVDSDKAAQNFVEKEKGQGVNTSLVDAIISDPSIQKLIAKSDLTPGFEKASDDISRLQVSKKELWRQRKAQREQTKGADWFDLRAVEMTDERERDLEIIQMRDALDTKVHYKKNDRSVLPKFFQIGTVVENKADFYSSRIPKKQRKRTIVEELMADAEFQTKQRKKFQEIKAREAITRRGAFRHRKFPKKKKRTHSK